MKPKIIFYLATFILQISTIAAQISSPGLGSDTNADSWFAIGIRQDLDTLGKIRSVSYLGLGRKSKPVDFNAVEREALIVLNQEFYHRFRKHWQFSYALSYRRGDEYKDVPPYDKAIPFYKHEFRTYGRISYLQNLRRANYSITLRQELRKFHTAGTLYLNENLQLRTRLKTQLTVNLNENKVHRITGGAEMFFKTEQESGMAGWSDYRYDESRLTFFYSYAPKRGRIIYSVGYMDDLVDSKNVSYLMINLVFTDLFSLLKLKLNMDSPEIY